MTTSRRDFLGVAAVASVPLSLGFPTSAQAAPPQQSSGNVVKYFLYQSVTTLLPVTATTPLPATSVCLAPGRYLFNGQGYDCTRPGLYCFWAGGYGPVESRIVGSSSDPYALLSAVAWHHVHGAEDEYLWSSNQLQLLSNAGMQHKWRLRCGAIVDLVNWLLPQFGYTVRRVGLRTLETTNGLDDGHIVIEVMQANAWRLWDLTNGCYFTSNGIHLSAAQIISTGVLNCARVVIDDDDKIASSVVDLGSNIGSFCFSSYHDIMVRTETEMNAWFARIYQDPYLI